MSDAFGIEPLVSTVTLDVGDATVVEVDVTNGLDSHVQVTIQVRGEDPLEPGWVTVEPGSFPLDVNEGRRVSVRVAPPAGTTPGDYRFTLRVYDVDRPADAFASSPPVTVVVKAAEREEGRGTPPWLVPALSAVLVLVVGLTVWSIIGNNDNRVVNGLTPTPVDPTNDQGNAAQPEPGPPTLTADGLAGCQLLLDQLPDADRLFLQVEGHNHGDRFQEFVEVAIERDGQRGAAFSVNAAAPADDSFTVDVPVSVRADDYGSVVTLTVILDPNDVVHEDSTLTVEVDLQQRPATDTELPCRER